MIYYSDHLKHLRQDKKVAIFKTIFSDGFSSMKMYEFRLRFHLSLFARNGLAPARRHAIIWTNDGEFSYAYKRQSALTG